MLLPAVCQYKLRVDSIFNRCVITNVQETCHIILRKPIKMVSRKEGRPTKETKGIYDNNGRIKATPNNDSTGLRTLLLLLNQLLLLMMILFGFVLASAAHLAPSPPPPPSASRGGGGKGDWPRCARPPRTNSLRSALPASLEGTLGSARLSRFARPA